MASEDPSKQSSADDPTFLASLSALDRGITDTPRATAPPPQGVHRPRRLLDLFPVMPGASASPLESAPLSEKTPSDDAPAQRRPRRRVPQAKAVEVAIPGSYETFYGLSERPFSLTSDPRFLYHSTAHDRAAQSMLDAIRRRDGIVVLTGDLGMGKTMLCRAVMEQLDRRTLTSFVADPFDTPEGLLRTVLVDFGVVSQADAARGLAQASRADLSAALRDFLYSLAPLQAFAVVIIDEAESLSVELLEQIHVLADTGGDEHLLQLMLVGQPSLATTLLKPELRALFQRVSARTTLGGLASDEISGYIARRIELAGPSARVDFAAAAVERIFELSRGVPRIVNLVCDRALAAGYRESASTIDERLVNEAADDLDLAPRESTSLSALFRAAMVAALIILALAGAAAGAFVFRSDVAAIFDKWQARPAPPPAPSPALPAPYSPLPAAEAEKREAQDVL